MACRTPMSGSSMTFGLVINRSVARPIVQKHPFGASVATIVTPATSKVMLLGAKLAPGDWQTERRHEIDRIFVEESCRGRHGRAANRGRRLHELARAAAAVVP